MYLENMNRKQNELTYPIDVTLRLDKEALLDVHIHLVVVVVHWESVNAGSCRLKNRDVFYRHSEDDLVQCVSVTGSWESLLYAMSI